MFTYKLPRTLTTGLYTFLVYNQLITPQFRQIFVKDFSTEGLVVSIDFPEESRALNQSVVGQISVAFPNGTIPSAKTTYSYTVNFGNNLTASESNVTITNGVAFFRI